jgi:hypothetical protein
MSRRLRRSELMKDVMLNRQYVRSSIKRVDSLLRREIAFGLVVLIAMPFGGSSVALAQQTTPIQQPGTGISSSQSSSQSSNTGQARPGTQTSPTADGNQQPDAPRPAQVQQNGTPAPVGTAVAPYEKGIGIAASRPAGAVIAPAKQRRTRSFVIKTGLIIGAAVAVGTVVALSSGSPSRPQVQ